MQGNYISKLVVCPESRRQGLGSALIKRAQSKYTHLSLHVATEREAALALYLKMGFTVQRTIKNYYMEGRDALSMTWGAS